MTDSVSQSAGGIGDLRKARRVKPAALNTDRLPPHAPEAEQGVLGCILLAPNECLGQCVELLPDGKDTFYDLRHQTIYETLLAMFQALEPVDVITLQQKLKDAALLEQTGGIPYLNTLQDSVPSAANVTYYSEIVQEKHELRKLVAFCSEQVGKVYDFTGDVSELKDQFEADCLKLFRRETKRGVADIKAIQNELTNDYEAAMDHKAPMGLMTGFTDLDRQCGGMMEQEFIVIGGVPSSGKTTLALNIAVRVAKSGVKVAIYSFETSAKKLVHRSQSMLGQVEGGGFLRGDVTAMDVTRMIAGTGQLAACRDNILIHDGGAMTEAQLVASARRDFQAGARLFIVDYLQLLRCEGESETERASNASKCCKGVAGELNVPVIAISSLRKAQTSPSSGKTRNITMDDLRQSGQIMFDADKILLLTCDDVTAPVREVKCNVAKNKDGPLGDVNLTLFAGQFRFESVARASDADVPYTDH